MYFLTYNAQTGQITGNGVTNSDLIPEGAIQCTEDQYANPQAYEVVNGAVAPLAADQLAQIELSSAQISRSAAIDLAYAQAVTANVTFKTAGGISQSFQADAASQTLLMQATQGYQIAGSTPSGFYWKAADNTQVPFTLTDLQGLYATILAQGWAAFQKRSTLKAAINAITTATPDAVAAVQAVTW